jgi:hypothetical protein
LIFQTNKQKNRIEKQTECYQKKFSIDLMGCEKNKYLDIDSINKINTKKKHKNIFLHKTNYSLKLKEISHAGHELIFQQSRTLSFLSQWTDGQKMKI